jgi:hypothetical protein
MDVIVEEMEKRVVRWEKVKPYEQTFIESRLPGSRRGFARSSIGGSWRTKGFNSHTGFTSLRGYPHRGPGRTARRFAFS